MNRLQKEFEISDGLKVNRLLTELDLGDRKPSHLLREMRILAGTSVKDDFLKSMFLQRLPLNIKTILATSNDSLGNLAAMADKIIEISPPSCAVNAVGTSASNVAALTPTADPIHERLSRLETQLAQLVNSIEFHQLSSAVQRAIP